MKVKTKSHKRILLPSMDPETTASVIKRMVIGCLIAEYAMRELPTHASLKKLTTQAIFACNSVQNYLINHPGNTPENTAIFKKQFLRDNAVLMGNLIELVWDLDSEDMEDLIMRLRSNIDEEAVNADHE